MFTEINGLATVCTGDIILTVTTNAILLLYILHTQEFLIFFLTLGISVVLWKYFRAFFMSSCNVVCFFKCTRLANLEIRPSFVTILPSKPKNIVKTCLQYLNYCKLCFQKQFEESDDLYTKRYSRDKISSARDNRRF